jgi:hypothetical protein
MSGKSKKLYSSASYDYISGLVDLILRDEDIPEELLKRIGRVLGAKWRCEFVDFKRGSEGVS